MATLAQNVLTLSDWAKRRDPNGQVPVIVELLGQTNRILDDMLWREGNLPTGHEIIVRTGLPDVFWRLLNQGIQPSKSDTAQIVEAIGMLEAWSEVDIDLAKLDGNVNAFRLSEARAFLEAMNQEMASTLFYGNAGVNPEEFNGLSVRYSSLTGAENSDNVLDGGGVQSDNLSVWLVGWGENTAYGVFPKGSPAGLVHEDFGEQTIETTNGIAGQRMRGYQERWQWKAGLAVKDWRYIARIANIDVSSLVTKAGAANMTELMIEATHVVNDLDLGNFVFYMNRTAFAAFDIQRFDNVQAGGQLSYEVVDGRRIPMFRGIPIKRVDALTVNEAVVA